MGKGNLRLKTYCPEDVDLTKTQPWKCFVHMQRGNPSRELRVDYANSNVLWLFDCNHLTPVIVLWQMQKFMSLYKFLLCLIFNLRAIPSTGPGGLYSRGDLTEGFFSVTSLGAYTWRDLFLEFYGIYHDEFFILIIYVRVISCTYIFITMANPFPHSSPGEGRVGVAIGLNPVPFRLVISRS